MTERDAIEREAVWRGPRRSRIDPATYNRPGHFVVNGGGLRFRPTRGMTNGEPAWFRRRVERARRQKAAEAFAPTVRVPALTPPPTGDNGRASRKRRRTARKATSRPSDDDSGPPSPRDGSEAVRGAASSGRLDERDLPSVPSRREDRGRGGLPQGSRPSVTRGGAA